MKCVIVDDEEISRKIIQQFVEKTDFLELKGLCTNGIEAAEVLRKDAIDILFLDVEMPEMDGIELIKTMKEKPQIILITSKEKYAVEAFEFDVTDYIVKPPTYARFLKAVNKVREILLKSDENEISDEFIFIKSDSRLVKIDTKKIFYIEAQRDYVNIVTNEQSYIVYSTMKGIKEKLPHDNFVRVHRSFIISLDKINDIEDNTLLINKKIIPIGASHKASLMKRLKII